MKWNELEPIPNIQPTRPLVDKMKMQRFVVDSMNQVFSYDFINGKLEYLYLYQCHLQDGRFPCVMHPLHITILELEKQLKFKT